MFSGRVEFRTFGDGGGTFREAGTCVHSWGIKATTGLGRAISNSFRLTLYAQM